MTSDGVSPAVAGPCSPHGTWPTAKAAALWGAFEEEAL